MLREAGRTRRWRGILGCLGPGGGKRHGEWALTSPGGCVRVEPPDIIPRPDPPELCRGVDVGRPCVGSLHVSDRAADRTGRGGGLRGGGGRHGALGVRLVGLGTAGVVDGVGVGLLVGVGHVGVGQEGRDAGGGVGCCGPIVHVERARGVGVVMVVGVGVLGGGVVVVVGVGVAVEGVVVVVGVGGRGLVCRRLGVRVPPEPVVEGLDAGGGHVAAGLVVVRVDRAQAVAAGMEGRARPVVQLQGGAGVGGVLVAIGLAPGVLVVIGGRVLLGLGEEGAGGQMVVGGVRDRALEGGWCGRLLLGLGQHMGQGRGVCQ